MFNCKTLISLVLSGVIALGAQSAVINTTDIEKIDAVVKSYDSGAHIVTMLDIEGNEWYLEDTEVSELSDIYEITFYAHGYEPISLSNKETGETRVYTER